MQSGTHCYQQSKRIRLGISDEGNVLLRKRPSLLRKKRTRTQKDCHKYGCTAKYSARADGWNYGNLISLLDHRAFFTLCGNVYIIHVDRYQT